MVTGLLFELDPELELDDDPDELEDEPDEEPLPLLELEPLLALLDDPVLEPDELEPELLELVLEPFFFVAVLPVLEFEFVEDEAELPPVESVEPDVEPDEVDPEVELSAALEAPLPALAVPLVSEPENAALEPMLFASARAAVSTPNLYDAAIKPIDATATMERVVFLTRQTPLREFVPLVCRRARVISQRCESKQPGRR